MKKYYIVVLTLFLIIVINCLWVSTPVAAESVAKDEVYLPVIMYHQIFNKNCNKYRITPKMLDEDLTELEKQGYTTVCSADIINFIEGKKALPEKSVLITFDDGYFNNDYYGEEIFKKHNAKAIINVVGGFTDLTEKNKEENNPRFSYLTWEQIKNINKDVFEIGNHSYNLHKRQPRFGMARLSGENELQYKKVITDDIQLMQDTLKEKAEIEPIVFAYPFGKYNDNLEDYLSEAGFKIILTCVEKTNKIHRGDDLPLVLGRFNRGNNYSSAEFVKKIGNRA